LNLKVDLYSDDAGVGNTYHDLLLREDIHSVIIALPILSQPEYIEAALAAGKHVLSEKPIAGDLKRAEALIKYYKSDKVKNKATWAWVAFIHKFCAQSAKNNCSVAENFRFFDSYKYASQEILKLGRILGFHVTVSNYVKPDNKYYSMFALLDMFPWLSGAETPWRTKPEYQGGFLLDGGVHSVAGIRLMLGEAAKPKALSAYTALLQAHLPPADTITSIWQTAAGVPGTFSMSFGTTLSGSEFTVACENGSVTVIGNKVTVRQGLGKDGNSTEKEFKDEGVKNEVKAWAESIANGKLNPLQSPEQALADLEILEKMLKSGEGHGKTESLQFQV
jgi:predicted dehydrogenase